MRVRDEVQALEQRIEALEDRLYQLGLVREMIDEAGTQEPTQIIDLRDHHQARLHVIQGDGQR